MTTKRGPAPGWPSPRLLLLLPGGTHAPELDSKRGKSNQEVEHFETAHDLILSELAQPPVDLGKVFQEAERDNSPGDAISCFFITRVQHFCIEKSEASAALHQSSWRPRSFC